MISNYSKQLRYFLILLVILNIFIFYILGNNNLYKYSLGINLIIFYFFFFQKKIFNNLFQLWIKLGKILNFITSKIIIFIFFFILITPVAILFKIFNRDKLKLKFKKNSEWIDNKDINFNFDDQF